MRANKGGQYGKNGAWYDGGQFLPSSEGTEKGANSRRPKGKSQGPRKQQIAPYLWEVSEKKSIWGIVAPGFYTKFVKTGYSKETGAQGYIEVYPSNVWNSLSEDKQTEIKELIRRWNAGERWV